LILQLFPEGQINVVVERLAVLKSV